MKILFIAWDGPYVSYLESLFLPIFYGLKAHGFEFHVIQFSWASKEKVERIQTLCNCKEIPYTHCKVYLKPHPIVGKFITLATANKKIIKYIKQNHIDVVMPRGLMPASIVLRILKQIPSLHLIYDADGLQIEERVDFAGLKVGSIRYKQLKKIECAITKKADAVLTRSFHAGDFLIQQYGENIKVKLFRVVNGRDEKIFQRATQDEIKLLRSKLNIPEQAFVSVYCGSLTPQYCLPEMAKLHSMMLKFNPHVYWLVLTTNIDEMQPYLDLPNVIVRTADPMEVPKYLSIANMGLALRKATFSLKGVAPIKLGEYILAGLPVIASAGIGDTEQLLAGFPFCLILNDFSDSSIVGAKEWIRENEHTFVASNIREAGLQYFSLSAAVSCYRKAIEHLL